MRINTLKQMILGLDLKNYNLKILKPNKKQKEYNFDLVPFDKQLYFEANFYEIFNSCLNKYFANNSYETQQTLVVLPDCFLGMDYINVPNLNKSKIVEALKMELSNLYNIEKLEINSDAISANKSNYIFQINYLNRQVKEDIYKALINNKLMPNAITFESASMVNFCLANSLIVKNQTFAILDIQNGETNFAICEGNRIVSFDSLDFGYEILDEKQLISEKSLSNNKYAENMVNEINKTIKNGIKIVVKNQKPTNAEEFVLSNFKIFEKRLLLCINKAKEENLIDNIERIIVNLPSKYNYIVEKLNEKNNIYKTCDFDDKISSLTQHNMDLFGAIYCKNLNTNLVF